MVRIACELFLQHGYEHTSVDEIIHQAGGSKAHVYRKFGGKEELFFACVEHLCDEVQLSIETPDLSKLAAEPGLRLMAQALADVLLGERTLSFQRLVFAEAARFPRVGEIWFRRGPQTTVRTFSRGIERWMQAGEMRPGDARLMAALFCDMLSGHLLDRAWLGIGRKPSPAEVKKTIDGVVSLFLHGCGEAAPGVRA